MRSLLLASLSLLSGCALVAPFDLGALPGVDAGGDSDAEADLESDSQDDADSRDDADSVSWDPWDGCRGDVSEERWVVAALEGDVLVGYVTERDCREPLELCRGCYPAAISPSGQTVLVVEPGAFDAWRVEDVITLLALDPAGPEPPPLRIRGASPSWLDDDTFFYIAQRPGVEGPCDPVVRDAVQVDIRRREISTRHDEAVGAPVLIGLQAVAPVASPSRSALAYAHDMGRSCNLEQFAISIRDLGTLDDLSLRWTSDDPSWHLPLGLLPDGSGFLLQQHDQFVPAVSRLYVVSFHGESLRVVEGLAATVDPELLAGQVEARWPSCGTVRRLGPACELYCREHDSTGFYRITLPELTREEVACAELGEEVRIMDVWQR